MLWMLTSSRHCLGWGGEIWSTSLVGVLDMGSNCGRIPLKPILEFNKVVSYRNYSTWCTSIIGKGMTIENPTWSLYNELQLRKR